MAPYLYRVNYKKYKNIRSMYIIVYAILERSVKISYFMSCLGYAEFKSVRHPVPYLTVLSKIVNIQDGGQNCNFVITFLLYGPSG